jgi:aminoglycoside 3-N-acetyltransferase
VKPHRRSLTADLAALGVAPGDVVMVHASLRAVGPVIGGAAAVVHALLDAIGEHGTLAAYVDVELFWDEERDDPALMPVFDPRTTPAARDHGVLHEVIRTWPGAVRSAHPDAGVVAIGPRAAWLTAPHPFRYGYGEGTPFARFVEARGKVLMLGAPLDTITLLHHAEHLARIPEKRVWRYRRRLLGERGPEWGEFEEFDTGDPVSPRLDREGAYFERIGFEAVGCGIGRRGHVGRAESFLFDGPALVAFGVEWLERVAG